MNARAKFAEQCLVATCAHLSLAFVRDENFPMWLKVLKEVLANTGECSDVLVPVRASAEILAYADAGIARDNAMARLRVETARYYQIAAGFRYEKWRDSVAGEVIDR